MRGAAGSGIEQVPEFDDGFCAGRRLTVLICLRQCNAVIRWGAAGSRRGAADNDGERKQCRSGATSVVEGNATRVPGPRLMGAGVKCVRFGCWSKKCASENNKAQHKTAEKSMSASIFRRDANRP